MDVESLLEEFRRAIRGRPITWTRLAADRLILYIDCEPGDPGGFIIACDPAWQVCDAIRVTVGSYQAARTCEDESALDRTAEPLLALRGRTITDISVQSRSRDLTVDLEDGFTIRTLADDVGDDDGHEFWHMRDVARDWTLYSQPSGWFVREPRGSASPAHLAGEDGGR